MSDDTSSQVAVMARIPAAPGKRGELAAALQVALDNAAAESGTTYYILHEDPADADSLWMYELYADQAALDLHMASEGYKALGPTIVPFLGGRPELTFLKPLGGKGI